MGPAEHSKAGPSQVVDPIGADVASEAGMQLCILDGRSISALRSAIEGEEFGGTVVL